MNRGNNWSLMSSLCRCSILICFLQWGLSANSLRRRSISSLKCFLSFVLSDDQPTRIDLIRPKKLISAIYSGRTVASTTVPFENLNGTYLTLDRSFQIVLPPSPSTRYPTQLARLCSDRASYRGKDRTGSPGSSPLRRALDDVQAD